MKKWFLMCIISLLLPVVFFAQAAFPSYPDVLNKFFNEYSFETEDYTQGLLFAKRKDGWYADVVDRMKSDSILSEQLFWSAATGKYQPLKYMTEGDPEKVEEKMDEYLSGGSISFNYYGYERCRYYGYNNWAEDMINDFRNYTGTEDTLLEGLGRAYSSFASNYLWYHQGGTYYGNDPLRQPLGMLEMPSQERILKVKLYIDSAIMVYKKLAELHPRYQAMVGNSAMKVFNETMHGYMMMKMCRNDLYAGGYLSQVAPDQTILAIAKNYLSACAPNAILFTYGDNDTYPLLYAQESQKYRRDVTVINISLLGLVPWVKGLKESKKVVFSTTPEQFGRKEFEYARYEQRMNWPESKQATLAELVKMLQLGTYRETGEDFSYLTYPAKEAVLAVNPALFAKVEKQPGIGNSIVINLDNYLFSSEILLFDILVNNINTRPVYFTYKEAKLGRHLQREGLIFHVVPLKEGAEQPTAAAVQHTENYLAKEFIPTFSFSNTSITLANDFDAAIMEVYYLVAAQHQEKGRL
ncbi:MAG: hypothetical protein JNM88_07920, partial [Chitinophagaceae bacterium]|nr:hypothetical protein [Chitinophagaceae bacterium]